MSPGLKLAEWVLASARERVTHLKLQKLVFYCYGAALAYDRESEVGQVLFEAWEHGPVCVDVWRRFRDYAAAPLPVPTARPWYTATTERPLRDAIDVYQTLTAWALRNETHFERPWQASWESKRRRIDPQDLKSHFYNKYRRNVTWPEALGRPSSLAVDGLPSETFASLHDLAQAVRAT